MPMRMPAVINMKDSSTEEEDADDHELYASDAGTENKKRADQQQHQVQNLGN